MKKLPKELVVVVEEEGTDNEFLNAIKTASDAAEQGKTKRAGVYVLKELITIKGVACIEPGK